MVDGPNPSSCMDIPAVMSGQDATGTVHSCAGNLFYDSFEKTAPKVAKVEVVRRDGSPDSGTSFFVQDGTHVVTNNHVVQNASELQIRYNNKDYQAVVEKVDDVDDLAELKIIGLDADSSRSIKIADGNLTPDQRVVGVGVPGVPEQTKFVNGGVYKSTDTLYNLLKDPLFQNPEIPKIVAAYNSGDRVLKQEAIDRANAPRMVFNMGGKAGESGSPAVDNQGNLAGVMTTAIGNNFILAVPASKVRDLVNNPETKFNINNAVDTSLTLPKLTPAIEDTAGVAVAITGLLGKGRVLPLAYGAARAVNLVSEIKELGSTTYEPDRNHLKVEIAQDGAMVAGGALTAALWSSPVGRYAGLGLMGLSLASRFFTDSSASRYQYQGVTRKNGDAHPAWID